MNKLPKTIVANQISIQWNDNPKLVVLMHDMPEYVRQPFDEWLSEIEAQENAKWVQKNIKKDTKKNLKKFET